MPRDDRSYSQAMRDHDAEKKFLRKIRHRAFHPDADSPVLFQLAGYFVRLVIIVVILGGIFFIRNRKYFNGPDFAMEVQEEMDAYLDGDDSKAENSFWKGDQFLINYHAQGGPRAFFKEITLDRITARASWNDLLLNNGWKLSDVEIGDAHVALKAGPSPQANEPLPERIRSSSWFSATPDFNQTRFGEIKIHNASFMWGPIWTSEGSLTNTSGILQRKLGDWSMILSGGTLRQNWLRGLTMVPGTSINVGVEDGRLQLSGGEFTLGKAGHVSVEGFIQLGEAPEFNLKFSMKTIDVEDILPKEFLQSIAGLADFELSLTGSPNRSDGIAIEGEMVMVEGGRLREIPILRTMSVITPRSEMRLMPIRSGSRVKFKTRQGLLTVTEMSIQGGGAAVGVTGFKRADGEVLDYARLTGAFTYQMDTTSLDETLKLESIKKPLEEDLTEEGPQLGFKGNARVGMPWELLGGEPSYRDKHFQLDAAGYGWIDVPINGLLDEITVEQAKILDLEWAELAKRAKTSFN